MFKVCEELSGFRPVREKPHLRVTGMNDGILLAVNQKDGTVNVLDGVLIVKHSRGKAAHEANELLRNCADGSVGAEVTKHEPIKLDEGKGNKPLQYESAQGTLVLSLDLPSHVRARPSSSKFVRRGNLRRNKIGMNLWSDQTE